MPNFSMDELSELLGGGKRKPQINDTSFVIGEDYLIRTVTLYHVGKVLQITDSDLVLTKASWVSCTGRFHECLKSGILEEVEPFVDDVIVSRGAIVDATRWNHKLPEEVK